MIIEKITMVVMTVAVIMKMKVGDGKRRSRRKWRT